MKVNWINWNDSPARSVALGTFDGVHLGHQKLLDETISLKPVGGTTCVCTFDIPPEQYFKGQLRLVSSFERRVELIRSFGIDEVMWLPFGPEFTSMTAQDFVEKILVEEMKTSAVVCGYNYRFGKGRGGDAEYLQEQGKLFGFSVTVVPQVYGNDGDNISSTVIRQLLSEGNLAKASEYLGYYPTHSASVVSRESSCVNLGFNPDLVLPGKGVYLVNLITKEKGTFAIAYLDPGQATEVCFLKSDSKDIGNPIEVQFLHKLRALESQQSFESDVMTVRQLLPGFHLQGSRVVLK